MDPQTKSTTPFILRGISANLWHAQDGACLPPSSLIPSLIQFANSPFFCPLQPIMSASKVQCKGCGRWFSPSGLSIHISKTQKRPCRTAIAVSQVPRVSSSIQPTARSPPLSPNRVSPVSIGGSPDGEYDHTRSGEFSDTEFAVTQGAH